MQKLQGHRDRRGSRQTSVENVQRTGAPCATAWRMEIWPMPFQYFVQPPNRENRPIQGGSEVVRTRFNSRIYVTCLNEARVSAPAIDNAPLNIAEIASLGSSIKFIKTAPCRATTILWVLREYDSSGHAVCFHFPRCLSCQRIGVAEGDVGLMRSSLRVKLV